MNCPKCDAENPDNDSMDNDNSLSFTVKIWIVRDGQVVQNDSERVDTSLEK